MPSTKHQKDNNKSLCSGDRAYLKLRCALALENGGDVETDRLDLPEESRGRAVLHHSLHLQGQLLRVLHRDGFTRRSGRRRQGELEES